MNLDYLGYLLKEIPREYYTGDAKLGDFTKDGVVTRKDDEFISFLERGTIIRQPFGNIKGVIGEQYVEDGIVKGIVITNKDEDGYFQMKYSLTGVYCKCCGRVL
jgi:hypothetical protein